MMLSYLLLLLLVEISMRTCWCLKEQESTTSIRVKICDDSCDGNLGCICFLQPSVTANCTLRPVPCNREDFHHDNHKVPERPRNSRLEFTACKCIQTIRKGVTCIELYVADAQDGVVKKEDFKDSNILTVFLFSERVDFRLYNPNRQNFVGDVSSCRVGQVRAVLYVKTLNMVFLTPLTRDRITLKSLKRNHCFRIHERMEYGNMGHHRRQQRVYILRTKKAQLTEIISMAIDGSDMKCQIVIPKRLNRREMALDDQKDLVYVNAFRAVLLFTTQGLFCKTFSISKLDHLQLNPSGSILYYNKHRSLFGFNTLTSTTRAIEHCSRLPVYPTTMAWFLGKILVASHTQCDFVIMENEKCRDIRKFKFCKRGLIFAPGT